jgi:hypothetical protein
VSKAQGHRITALLCWILSDQLFQQDMKAAPWAFLLFGFAYAIESLLEGPSK